MSARSPLAPGSQLGAFRIEEEIGRGSFAVVYAARHEATGEEVALKWLLDDLDTASLKREFRIARALTHRHLVRLHEMHAGPRGAYFTMEPVRGGDVVSRCLRERDPAERVRTAKLLFAQLADALAHLHAAALVHRDVKPGNVLVRDPDHVVLVDFGLAQSLHELRTAFSGTFAYAAPERLRGEPATPRSDWFSFGVLLFEALAGTLPMGPDPRATFQAWLSGRAVDVVARLPKEASSLAPLIEGLLEPSPERRLAAAEVFAALDHAASWTVARSPVGRADARAWLEERMGRRRILAITGEPGTGKTTLVRSVLDAERERAVVLASRCDPREHVPFNALDGAIVELLHRVRRRSTAQDPDTALLASVFADDGPVTAAKDAALLVGALARVLAAHAASRPIVLFIDDVQWIDHDSVPLVEMLVADTSLELTCVLVARGDLDAVPSALRPAAEDSLTLGPLDEDASATLLRQLVPTIDEPLVTRISSLARGRPLVLEQGAAWLLEEKGGALPSTWTELVVHRAERRSSEHREVLSLLAVHGAGLETDVLLACDGSTSASAYELLDAGLVEFERSAARYTVKLRHEQVAAAIVERLDGDARRRRHRQLADAFARARPAEVDALFQHLVGAGELERARDAALRAARAFRDALAFHRAAERLRWLIDHSPGPSDSLRRELADVLGRAGEAMQSGEEYLALARRAPAEERAELMRLASEQLLRAGDVARGGAILGECLRAAGMAPPRLRVAQIGRFVVDRLAIRSLPLRPPRRPAPDPATCSRIELAWSAGLGTNHVDPITSALSQAQFTQLALRRGSVDQVARALAVEYSYTMFAGGVLSSRRGARLRVAMAALERDDISAYSRAMLELSWAAGDFFRGRLEDVEPRVERARVGFEGSLGAKSWELANCGMYGCWAALEQGETTRVARRVPELLRIGTARGDLLYRQCFVRGPAAIAWLVEDRGDELASLLDALPAPEGPVQIAHFFDLVARHRLDLYRHRARAAWWRVATLWPAIRRSGLLYAGWMRFQLGLVAAQAAVAARDEPAAHRFAVRAIRALGTLRHPAARPWSVALDAVLRAPERSRERTLAALAEAEGGFERVGQRLAVRAVRHRRATLGEDVDVDWAGVARPDAFAAAVGLPAIRLPHTAFRPLGL